MPVHISTIQEGIARMEDAKRMSQRKAKAAEVAAGSAVRFDICYYNGLMFSEGSEILAPDGNTLVCRSGEWVKLLKVSSPGKGAGATRDEMPRTSLPQARLGNNNKAPMINNRPIKAQKP